MRISMKLTRLFDTRRKTAARPICVPRALLVLLLLLAAGDLCAAEPNRSVTLNIAAGTSLEQALLDLAQKTGLQLEIATYVVAGHKTIRLEGHYPIAEALSRLLQGSDLTYRITDNTLFVFRAEHTQSATVTPAQPKPPRPPKEPPPRNGRRDSENTETTMEVVRISTGTHIPNSSDTPGVRILTRADFERGGFQTVGDALRSLPQNFPGGFSPTVHSAGGSQNTPTQSAASSANLHGMGSASTLTLLNGQRLPPAEGSGGVDVTLIPISAVDRIEVKTGGASAVYGSDAVAGVVNIILRSDFQGLEAGSALGRALDGGGVLQHYSLVGGRAWDDGNASAMYDCAWQRPIDSSQRAFVPSDIAGTTLLPRSQYCSRVLSATQALPSGVAASLTGVYTSRANENSENLGALFPGVTASSKSSVTQFAAIATVRAPLGENWTGVLTSNVSEDDVGSPEWLSMNGTPYQNEGDRFDNRLRSVEVDADGTLLQIPTGAVKLAAGTGYNEETFLFATSLGGQFSIAQERRVRFAFAEALIPLLPPEADVGRAGSSSPLSLRLAGRTSWYSDVGATTNPKIGLEYRPTPNIAVAASWGTSYRAPTLLQQYNTSQVSLKFVPDPTASTGQSLALFDFGGNPRLQPEESSDFTLDFTFAPDTLPGASLELTWYDIDDRKRIEYPTPDTGNPFADPNVLPFVMRNPSPAAIAQALARSQFQNLAGANYSAADAVVLIDDRNQNISRQRASGVDFFATYSRDTPIGRLTGSLSVAYLELRQQVTSESPDLRLSGTVFSPPNLRNRLELDWNAANYLGSVFINYTGSSRNTDVVPQQNIASWTTVDATIGYIFPGSGHWGKTKLTLSALNVLDRRPPFVDTGPLAPPSVNFDSANASPIGRFLTLQVIFEH
jgi:iron complex outermembrane receptor protein